MDGSVKPLELNTTFDSYDELKESVTHYQEQILCNCIKEMPEQLKL